MKFVTPAKKMKFLVHLIVIPLLTLLIKEVLLDQDGLDDFPLDSGEETSAAASVNNHHGTNSNSPTVNGINTSDDYFKPTSNMVTDEENSIDRIDVGKLMMGERRVETFNKIMTGAMKKPGAKQRLAQVLPIIRSMSPTQKLALATMVMNQLMGKSGQPIINHLDNNTSELMLPISADIASIFHGIGKEQLESGRSSAYGGYYYNPLSAGYRPLPPNSMVYGTRRHHQHVSGKRGDDVPPEMMPPPPSNDSYADYTNVQPILNNNNKFAQKDFPSVPNDDAVGVECTAMTTNDICLEISSYPDIEILESISNVEYRHMFRALTDDTTQILNTDTAATMDELEIDRRQEVGNSVFDDDLKVCKSKVKHARPKRAKSMNGQWKYIVNTAEYTQTIRLETCLYADKSCSHLAEDVNSKCMQIFNYHRLLTWDETNGLSLDIFKVPTCCSCQIQNIPPFPAVKVITIKTTTPNFDSSLQENAVIVDEPSLIQPSLVQPPTVKQNRNRNRPTLQHSTPKRELIAKVKRPVYQQPVLQQPDINEPRPHIRYSNIGSGARKSSPSKPAIQRVDINDKDPPIAVNENNIYVQNVNQNAVSSATKVNYNYHPIIDFFKSASGQAKNFNDRMDIQLNSWLPITSGLRVMPKK